MPMRVAAFADDTEGIPDDAILYRRVVWNLIGGRQKCPPGAVASLNGNCFADWSAEKAIEEGFPGPCMSVGLSTVLEELRFTPEKMLENYPDYGLAFVTAAELRKLAKADGTPCPQGIMTAATDAEPWHGVVFDLAGGRRAGSAKNAIAKAAQWKVPLTNT